MISFKDWWDKVYIQKGIIPFGKNKEVLAKMAAANAWKFKEDYEQQLTLDFNVLMNENMKLLQEVSYLKSKILELKK